MIKKSNLFLFFVLTFVVFCSTLPALEWEYLNSRSFQARYAIAAYYLKNCEEVIEIGGYKTPISNFIENPKTKITVLDPLILPSEKENVEHLACLWQEWPLAIPENPYGVVIIGMDLENMSLEDWGRLYTLIDRSKMTVIEVPDSWKPSLNQLRRILKSTNKKISIKIGLDFEGNDFGDLSNSWPPRVKRTLFFLE